MLALCSSKTRRMASITWRGFWLVAALSRYTTGLPRTVCERTGKSARMRATSSEAVWGLMVTATALRPPRVQRVAHEVVTLRLELSGELRPARPDDAPIHEHVHEVGVYEFQDPLVMSDQEDPDLGGP